MFFFCYIIAANVLQKTKNTPPKSEKPLAFETIELHPLLKIDNLMPYDLELRMLDDKQEKITIESGQLCPLFQFDPSQKLQLQICCKSLHTKWANLSIDTLQEDKFEEYIMIPLQADDSLSNPAVNQDSEEITIVEDEDEDQNQDEDDEEKRELSENPQSQQKSQESNQEENQFVVSKHRNQKKVMKAVDMGSTGYTLKIEHSITEQGTKVITIYSPYWVLNQSYMPMLLSVPGRSSGLKSLMGSKNQSSKLKAIEESDSKQFDVRKASSRLVRPIGMDIDAVVSRLNSN